MTNESWLALSGAVSIRFPPPWIPCFTTVTLEMSEHHAACLTDINPFRKHLSNRIIVLRRVQQNWNGRSSTFLGVTYELTYISTMFDYQEVFIFSLFPIKPLDSSRCQWNPHDCQCLPGKLCFFFVDFRQQRPLKFRTLLVLHLDKESSLWWCCWKGA